MSYPYQIKSLDDYRQQYQQSIDDPASFWAGIAEHFQWKQKWENVLDWNFKEPKVEYHRELSGQTSGEIRRLPSYYLGTQ